MMIRNLLLVVAVVVLMVNYVDAINDCSATKSVIPTSTITKVIFKFTCNAVDIPNPSLPAIHGSTSSDFNEINLSPNFFSILPLNQLCLYTNVYSINLSYNQIAGLSNAFISLACLSGLKSLDFSYNSIMTPLLARDFADSLAGTLIYLNLNNNQIPYIQTSTFMRADGTSRFPNLLFIGLANNQLKTLDLLWPLSLPNLVLQVDIKNNQIDTLVNELGKKYTDSSFSHSLTGYRYVDCTGNSLKSISDWNLLQYGLNTAADFEAFLTRISNFDFRATSGSPFLSCYCPSSGLYLNTWYPSIKSALNMDAPINKLACANMKSMNIFAFPCAITNTSASAPHKVGSANLFAAAGLGAGVGASSSDGSSTSKTDSSRYLLLLLLLIPFSILLLILLFCFFGRTCQLLVFRLFKLPVCPCLRPDSGSMADDSGKSYDAAICYSDYDEKWIDRDLIPKITELRRGYNLKKISLSQRVTKDIENEFKSCRRLILIFSKQFIEREWDSQQRLHKILKRSCLDDSNSILMAVNKSNLTDQTLRRLIVSSLKSEEDSATSKSNLVNAGNEDRTHSDDDAASAIGPVNFLNFMRNQLKFQMIRSLTLNDIEVINYESSRFWTQFVYLMPYKRESRQKDKISEIKMEKPKQTPSFRYSDEHEYNSKSDSLPRFKKDLDDDFRLPPRINRHDEREMNNEMNESGELNYEGSTLRLKRSNRNKPRHRSDESLDRMDRQRISYLDYGDYASVPRDSQRSRSNDHHHQQHSRSKPIYEDDFESDLKYMNRK